MEPKHLVRISKFLSKHLRHDPAGLGLELEPGGWVLVEDLLRGCADRRFPVTLEELREVVAQSDKQRFAFDETGCRIRANQGHSVEVDLELTAVTPPAVLFHGTGHGSGDAVEREGLRKMRRHHVHLSPDVETATRVGARHGRPVIFSVDAGAMAAAGREFYCSQNGVWLVDEVPPEYLRRL